MRISSDADPGALRHATEYLDSAVIVKIGSQGSLMRRGSSSRPALTVGRREHQCAGPYRSDVVQDAPDPKARSRQLHHAGFFDALLQYDTETEDFTSKLRLNCKYWRRLDTCVDYNERREIEGVPTDEWYWAFRVTWTDPMGS